MYYNYDAASKYVIVYPQGVEGTSGAAWQGPSYANPDVDDVQFVADLLEHMKSNYCIDTDRVYASGKSNGGGFVDTLACSDTGDQFAAFAMAAAALYTDTSKESCSKKRAILESHGDADNTIPYAGGTGSGGQLPDVGKWVRFCKFEKAQLPTRSETMLTCGPIRDGQGVNATVAPERHRPNP